MLSQFAVLRLFLLFHICPIPSFFGKSIYLRGINGKREVSSNYEPIEDIKIITRKEWDADDPKTPANTLSIKPIEWVVVSHTATQTCFEQPECTLLVRKIQSLNMETKGWGNVGYNFLVGGDGNVYEGLGWDLQGARTKGYNDKSLGIALIGNFQDLDPTSKQIETTLRFLKYAVRMGRLNKEYKLIAQRQVAVTNSPGHKAYSKIRSWPHWTDHPGKDH